MIQFTNKQYPGVHSSPVWKASGVFTFENGWSISIIYGSMCYCDCRDSKTPVESCPTGEIAILNPKGEFVSFKGGDTVRGYSTADEIANIIHWTASQTKEQA